MPLFQQTDGDLTLLKQISFESERELQRLVESNLEQVYQLAFIETEFSPYGDLRIDTLAYDREQNAFVIIEYKNVGSFTVVDQGFAYLSLMLNHKADFVLKYNEKMKETKNVGSFDWSSSRVIFVAPSFTTYQREAANFQGMPYELWEARLYDGEVLSLSKLESGERSAQWSELKIENEAAKQIRKEVKVYSQETHFVGTATGTYETYELFREQMLALDSRLTLKAGKKYISVRLNGRTVFDIGTEPSNFYLSFPKKLALSDPEGKIQSESGYEDWLTISSEQDVPYALLIAKQAVDRMSEMDTPLYTVDDHFEGSRAAMRPAYDKLVESLRAIEPELDIHPRKPHIAFGIRGSRILYLRSYASKLEIHTPGGQEWTGRYADPKKIIRHDPEGSDRIVISHETDVADAVAVIQQILAKSAEIGSER